MITSPNKNIIVTFAAMCSVFMAYTVAPYLLQCKHKETYKNIIESTCMEAGAVETICSKCQLILKEEELAAKGHSFGDYFISLEPAMGDNGIETRVCSVCNEEESREYLCSHDMQLRELLAPTCSEVGINEATCRLCGYLDYLPIDTIPHEETVSVVIQESTCSVEGVEHLICVRCEAVAEERSIPLLECNWGEWEVELYATPFDKGVRRHTCKDCEKTLSETYEIKLEKNFLYIPEANILCKMAVTGFTQGAVDSNDVIYTKNAYGVPDASNPFVLGHWFGSLTTLWHTPVGAKIYINMDDKIDIYEVINSEYAIEMSDLYHIGQTTGVNVWDTYGSAMNLDAIIVVKIYGLIKIMV